MRNTQPRQRYEIGMVGLGVMGRNLLLNMADRGEIVEVGVPVVGLGEFFLSAAQFFVLHLQFDLVCVQVVNDSPDILGRHVRNLLLHRPQQRLGAFAEFPDLFWRVFVHSIYLDMTSLITFRNSAGS